MHVHLFYFEMWPILRSALENLHGFKWDLYVSIVNHDLTIEREIKKFKKDVKIIVLPNRGFDVGPFIEVLNLVDLSKYDFVIKLHSKREMPLHTTIENGVLDVSGSKWRDELLLFLSNRKNLIKSIKEFLQDPKLGMVSYYRLILRFSRSGQYRKYIFEKSNYFFNSIGIKPFPKDRFKFIAGTMFIARAEILIKLKNLDYSVYTFETTQRSVKEKDLAHALEYYIGWLATSQKNKQGIHFTIRDPFTSKIIQLFDIKYLMSNHYIIKKIVRFIIRNSLNKKTGEKELRIFKFLVIQRRKIKN